MLSLEMAILMLKNQQFLATPFATQEPPKKIEKTCKCSWIWWKCCKYSFN